MTDHEKRLYKRVLGIEAEQSLPLQLIRIHEEVEHAWHGLGFTDLKPEMLVFIMQIAGVLRRNDVEVAIETSGPTTPNLGEAMGTSVSVVNGPSLAITEGEMPNDITDAIPLNSAVSVDGVHDAKFLGWGKAGRMKILFADGTEKLIWKSRVKVKDG